MNQGEAAGEKKSPWAIDPGAFETPSLVFESPMGKGRLQNIVEQMPHSLAFLVVDGLFGVLQRHIGEGT
jgi:hypothetical protein